MKNKPILITLILSLILLIYVINQFDEFPFYNNSFFLPSKTYSGDIAFDEINSMNTLVQKIKVEKRTEFSGLEILFATYGAKIRAGENTLRIYRNDSLVYEQDFRSEELQDTEFYKFDNVDFSADASDEIVIKISSRKPDSGITAWVKTIDVSGHDLYKYDTVNRTYTRIPGEIGMKLYQRISLFEYLRFSNYRVKWYLNLVVLLIFPAVFALIYFLVKQSFVRGLEKNHEADNTNPML